MSQDSHQVGLRGLLQELFSTASTVTWQQWSQCSSYKASESFPSYSQWRVSTGTSIQGFRRSYLWWKVSTRTKASEFFFPLYLDFPIPIQHVLLNSQLPTSDTLLFELWKEGRKEVYSQHRMGSKASPNLYVSCLCVPQSDAY